MSKDFARILTEGGLIMYTIGELAEKKIYLCPKPYPKVLTYHQMLFNSTVNNVHSPVKPDSPLKPETAYYPPEYT